MLEGFELFKDPKTRNAPIITVRSSGQIGFSQGAVSRLGIPNGESFVQLYWNPMKRAIAIVPTKDGDAEGAIKVVRKTGNGPLGAVNTYAAARSFLERYDIPPVQTLRFRAEFSQDPIAAIIMYDKPVEARRRRAAAASQPTGAPTGTT